MVWDSFRRLLKVQTDRSRGKQTWLNFCKLQGDVKIARMLLKFWAFRPALRHNCIIRGGDRAAEGGACIWIIQIAFTTIVCHHKSIWNKLKAFSTLAQAVPTQSKSEMDTKPCAKTHQVCRSVGHNEMRSSQKQHQRSKCPTRNCRKQTGNWRNRRTQERGQGGWMGWCTE